MKRVLLGSTESIASYPKMNAGGLVLGVPSSATALRVTEANRDTVYQNATIDSLSATVIQYQEADTDAIMLSSSVTIVKGNRYLVTDALTGARFEVIAAKSGSSNVLQTEEPLPCEINAGSTVNGLAVSIALTTAMTEKPCSGYVLFRATVDGIVREWDESFRVVRRITGIALSSSMIPRFYPVVRQIVPADDHNFEESITAAWDLEVVPLLSVKGILDEDIITDDVIVPLHAAATIRHLLTNHLAAPPDFVARFEQHYEQIKNNFIARVDLSIRDQEQSIPEVPAPNQETINLHHRVTR
jgi:hypothetical protein